MTEYSQYYEKNLYPLQNKILCILNKCENPFYLTGDTALSRFYFNHRYSDDLDLFVNSLKENDFLEAFASCYKAIKDEGFVVNLASEITAMAFKRLYVSEKENPSVRLKIEFINDIDLHYGAFKKVKEYNKVDSLLNILTNKYTALYKLSTKDCVDICEICKHTSFNWGYVIKKANEKEVGISISDVSSIICNCSTEALQKIKWTKPVDIKQIQKDLQTISDDMLLGKNNSICLKGISLNPKRKDIDFDRSR